MEQHILSGSLLQRNRNSRRASDVDTSELMTLQEVIENTTKEIEEVFQSRSGKIKVSVRTKAA